MIITSVIQKKGVCVLRGANCPLFGEKNLRVLKCPGYGCLSSYSDSVRKRTFSMWGPRIWK